MSTNGSPRSLVGDLRRTLLVALGILLAGVFFALERFIAHHLLNEFDRALLAKAQTVALLLEQDEEGVDFDYYPTAMPEFAPGRDASVFELWLVGWKTSVRAASLGAAHLPRRRDRAPQPRFADGGLPHGRAGRLVQLDFLPTLDPAEQLDPATTIRPEATLVLGQPRARLDALLIALRAGLVGAFALALAGTWWALRIIVADRLAPLAALGDQIGRLHAGALSARVALPEPVAELTPLVDRMNALLAALETAFEHEQAFAGAAAHELRTPLAEIRALAEVATKFGDDAAMTREYLNEIVSAVTQLEHVTRGLLTLARADGSTNGRREEIVVDLIKLTHEAWLREAETAMHKGLTLRIEGADAAQVRTIPEIAELMLSNLVSNAVAHGTAHQPVIARTAVREGRLTFELINAQADLTTGDLAHVFDRFWRKDSARRTDGHVGLGLALVRSAAQTLDIACTARLDDRRRFVVCLAGFEVAPPESEHG